MWKACRSDWMHTIHKYSMHQQGNGTTTSRPVCLESWDSHTSYQTTWAGEGIQSSKRNGNRCLLLKSSTLIEATGFVYQMWAKCSESIQLPNLCTTSNSCFTSCCHYKVPTMRCQWDVNIQTIQRQIGVPDCAEYSKLVWIRSKYKPKWWIMYESLSRSVQFVIFHHPQNP